MTPAPSTTVSADALFDAFRSADPEFSPCPLWWWSGDPLDPERLKWQMDRFREGGVWNLVVINLAPTGPLYGHFADDPPFNSDGWWAVFREVCEHAKTTGMRVWFYDQIGFSGANIQGQIIARQPAFAGETIDRVTATATGQGEVTVRCPSDGTPLAGSVRRLDDRGQPTGPSQSVAVVDGAATWSGPGMARVSLIYAAQRGFDYFSEDACADLIDTIHGEFERRAGEFFPDVVVGSFQDELPTMPAWGPDFAEAFERQHGYAITPLLDALWEDLDSEERRVRRDYHATRAALAERAFFKPLFAWHDARGLLMGVDQQGPARTGNPEATVRTYADYPRTHRWFNAPGCDHHGDSKFQSSLAHLYGHTRVWLESFHSSGWGSTIEETFDWLTPFLRAGATLYDPHATYYSTRGGWFEWAPPSTDWRQPYWAHYRTFADAVARLCRLLGAGRHDCDIGLLHPTAAMQSGIGLGGVISDDANAAHETYLDLTGRMTWFDQKTGRMDLAGVDYDVLDDDSIASAAVEPGRLRIAEETYRTILLPACHVLERPTAERLLAFAEGGGEILAVGIAPSFLTGDDDDDSLIERLRERIEVVEPESLDGRLTAREPLVEAPVPVLVRRVDETTVVFVPAIVHSASTVAGFPMAAPAFNRTRYATEMTIQVRDVTGVPELWDPFLGTRSSMPASRCRAIPGGVEIDVPFAQAACALLVWGAASDAGIATLPEFAQAETLAELDDIWDVTVIPTLDNRWGDFTFPASTPPFPVQQWTFDTDADHGSGPVIATFGPRAEWIGPGQPDHLAALDASAVWNVAHWSLSRGIHKDPLHPRHLGPAGHVPEEFVEFGAVAPGEAVRLRSRFIMDEVDEADGYDGWFVIGAAAAKRIWIDGQELAIDFGENLRYQTAAAVRLAVGGHAVEIELTARHDLKLRMSMALVADLAPFGRPDRLTVAGESAPETAVRFTTTFAIDRPVRSALLQVATRGAATIALDDREIGRQGGFMPYGDGAASQRYDLAGWLAPGEHQVSVAIDAAGGALAVVVDGVIAFADGSPDHWLTTGPEWTVTRDGEPAQLAIEPRSDGDPALASLRQRPHPLPGAAWLEGAAADTGVVRPTAWHVDSGSAVQRLRCVVPPGATEATIPVIGRATARLDEDPIGETAGSSPWTVALPNPNRIGRVLELRVETVPGFCGGAALAGPIEFAVGPGRLPCGNWVDLGLTDFSGLVHYRQRVALPETPSGGCVYLDLGDLRGSAEVRIDGESAGTVVVAPYRVEITDQLRGASGTGEIEVEVVVANTLGPYLQAASPTPFVFAGQTVSGLFGPVRIIQAGGGG